VSARVGFELLGTQQQGKTHINDHNGKQFSERGFTMNYQVSMSMSVQL